MIKEQLTKEQLTDAFEANPDDFEVLPRAEFDKHYYAKDFKTGPVTQSPTKWFKEFGPYCPERWALGQLTDGRLVRTNTAKETL